MPDVQRRRRKDNLGDFKQNLGTSGLKLDRENFAYRWVNEEKYVQRTSDDDYDPVKKPGRPAAGEEENTVRRLVGKHEDGSPKYAILCRKPREFYDEDRKRHDASVDETTTSIRRGRTGMTGSDENLYTPEEGVSLRNG